jgi:hypothetical protein
MVMIGFDPACQEVHGWRLISKFLVMFIWVFVWLHGREWTGARRHRNGMGKEMRDGTSPWA